MTVAHRGAASWSGLVRQAGPWPGDLVPGLLLWPDWPRISGSPRRADQGGLEVWPSEPDDPAHRFRVCGGSGWATTQAYPAKSLVVLIIGIL